MPNSYVQIAALHSPWRQRSFQATSWLIVDAVERPALLDRSHADSLYNTASPCSSDNISRDALLGDIFTTAEDHWSTLCFPPPNTVIEQDPQHAQLFNQLCQALDEAWPGKQQASSLPIITPLGLLMSEPRQLSLATCG
jgi:hypothetical protein